ncbi:hypothetical protein [Rummeliibacillus pycnus]|uniref:hypothetical protein n=1 Tax=Rummeliibacillus pycnus TaxID=101070 RepID=UPI003D28CA6F
MKKANNQPKRANKDTQNPHPRTKNLESTKKPCRVKGEQLGLELLKGRIQFQKERIN